MTPTPSTGGDARAWTDAELVTYVVRYGGMCRDCADEWGVCPSSGLPCENADKAVRHVFNALRYGHTHGFIDASSLLSALPADSLGQEETGK